GHRGARRLARRARFPRAHRHVAHRQAAGQADWISRAMSDIEEPSAPRRVIGTPLPAPQAVDRHKEPEEQPLVTDPPDPRRARNAERLVAALFVLAFIAGCGFIAAYIGLE